MSLDANGKSTWLLRRLALYNYPTRTQVSEVKECNFAVDPHVNFHVFEARYVTYNEQSDFIKNISHGVGDLDLNNDLTQERLECQS